MKVCTDACLFGAWMGKHSRWNATQRALDIGGGTGLLGLMLAQQHPLPIDVLEVNEAASIQAKENIQQSPWSHQIQVIHTALQDFHSTCKYDFIFSNPPFFEADLLSSNSAKNDAKHDTGLTLSILMESIRKLLHADGKAAIVIPYHRAVVLESLVHSHGLFIHRKMRVRQTPAHDYFRVMYLIGTNKALVIEEEMYIQSKDKQYSQAFVDLLQDYYLHL